MSDSRLTPAQLDQVRELHAAIRKWLDDSARTQQNEHIRANLPYVDLMFAFAFAALGDRPTTNKLTEDARRLMEGPIPVGATPQEQQTITAALVHNFMFKAFRYRVEQALAGQPHNGSLSGELLDEREALTPGESRPINNPYKLAAFVIDRFREQSCIVEPSERVDQYAGWAKHGDVMKKELAELHTLRDPVVLAERIRKLYREGVADKPLKEVQFYTLHEGLPLAARVNEAFVAELLELVPAALQGGMGAATESPDRPKKQGELLQRAMFLAGHFNREDIVKKLVDDFAALLHAKPMETRYRLINVVARQCVRSLKQLGLTGEIDRFLTQLHGEALDGLSVAEVKKKYAPNPEAWAAVLQTLLNLAGGWMSFGLIERAAPILAEARNELLGINVVALQPKDYTELARAYVAALGQSPSAEQGLAQMIELFCKMSPAKITNTWTTAQYYSRFHLCLVEDAVLAIVAK
jgi:cellulose synthase operon protein C